MTINEPILPMNEIQGIVVPGFAKPHETLLGFRLGDSRQTLQNFKILLQELSPSIATARETLNDRRDHRALRCITKERHPKSENQQVFLAVAFSYTGLRKLTPGADAIPNEAFRRGLAARSPLLGDPTVGEGSPEKWLVGGPHNELDVLFIIAGDERTPVTVKARELKAAIAKTGADLSYSDDGDVREDMPGREHFGFDDGISQPGIRGMASGLPDDFITDRHIAALQAPEASLFGYPGQDLVWPGVFLIGQQTTSPDPLVPGVPMVPVPQWTHNGSFLVFRRLLQDVGLFWRTMHDMAADLSSRQGFEHMSDDILAAKLVGRWPSGAPVNRVPDADNEDLGKCSLANNHFRFDSSAFKLPLDPPYDDTYSMSQADPAGIKCPWAAHIRKVNTRDSSSDMGGREATYSRRILRVGIPFGPPLSGKDRYKERTSDPGFGKRGLLFQCVQASIEDQFEFLMARWMGDPTRPKMPGGHDLLVGQNTAEDENRMRKCVLFGTGLQQAEIGTAAQWIIPTGGGYFFLPSIPALKDVLAV
jgi:Dyp-type peroxidase family